MIKQAVEISKVSIKEVEKLRAISIQTFTETFTEYNTESNMQLYLSENLNEDKLTQEVSDVNSQFYFVSLATKIIGYLKINTGPSQTELVNNTSLEIERIYVIKEFHGKHIGDLLLEKAIEIAKQHSLEYIWLGVWEKNTRAISFYKKHDFVEFDKHLFKLGDDVQTDLMMKLKL
jgi:ribosomal protein S18 acetylase RimI-like enzyme